MMPRDKAKVDSSLSPIVMQQQLPTVYPIWIGFVPGSYAEVERRPKHWSVRMYGKRALRYKQVENQEEATQHLQSFFGREIQWVEYQRR